MLGGNQKLSNNDLPGIVGYSVLTVEFLEKGRNWYFLGLKFRPYIWRLNSDTYQTLVYHDIPG